MAKNRFRGARGPFGRQALGFRVKTLPFAVRRRGPPPCVPGLRCSASDTLCGSMAYRAGWTTHWRARPWPSCAQIRWTKSARPGRGEATTHGMRLAWPLDQRRVCERCYRVPQGCRCIDTATSPEPCRNPKPGAPGSSRAQPKPVQQPKTKDFAQNKRPRPLPRPAPPMAASGSLARLLLGPPPAIRVVTVPTAIGGRARLALVSRSGRTYVCRPAVVAA